MTVRRPRGFTLVELMVVVAIIGLLASVAIPSFQASIAKTRRTDFEATRLQYRTMFVQYFREANDFPHGSTFYVSEPPLGPVAGDISGWSSPSSPYFPGKDIRTSGYKVEPWKSFTGFGAPMLSHSRHRYTILTSGTLHIIYAFHNFNNDGTTGYHYDEFLTSPALPTGYFEFEGDFNPDE